MIIEYGLTIIDQLVGDSVENICSSFSSYFNQQLVYCVIADSNKCTYHYYLHASMNKMTIFIRLLGVVVVFSVDSKQEKIQCIF